MKRPDPSRLGVAREELDDVFSGQERKAGLVLDRALRELTRGVVAQLDVQLVADVLKGDAVVVLHLPDENNHRADRAAPPCGPRPAAWRGPARCRATSLPPGRSTPRD